MISSKSRFGAPAIATLLLLSASTVACASKKPAESPAEATNEPAAETSGANLPGKDPAQGNLSIGPRIAEACGIQETEAFFDYNSAKVSTGADKILGQLVDCFTTGPLAGKSMRIVGHTDPRGDSEYNMTLGGRRADNVLGALYKKGLSKEKMESTSRGEIEARGDDEPGWAADRKVELLLAE